MIAHIRAHCKTKSSYRLPFGQHKGKPVDSVPTDYLEWLAGCEIDDTLMSHVLRVLRLRANAGKQVAK